MAITGLHAIIYSSQPEDVRAFLRDVLELPSVDAGGGWLIFAAPPAELAAHPSEDARHELYLMCDDIEATVAALRDRGIVLNGEITDAGWGLLTAIRLPGGSELGLYEPRHPSPLLPDG
jgi:predicted enzyme related to lactoylglutathione lyase